MPNSISSLPLPPPPPPPPPPPHNHSHIIRTNPLRLNPTDNFIQTHEDVATSTYQPSPSTIPQSHSLRREAPPLPPLPLPSPSSSLSPSLSPSLPPIPPPPPPPPHTMPYYYDDTPNSRRVHRHRSRKYRPTHKAQFISGKLEKVPAIAKRLFRAARSLSHDRDNSISSSRAHPSFPSVSSTAPDLDKSLPQIFALPPLMLHPSNSSSHLSISSQYQLDSSSSSTTSSSSSINQHPTTNLSSSASTFNYTCTTTSRLRPDTTDLFSDLARRSPALPSNANLAMLESHLHDLESRREAIHRKRREIDSLQPNNPLVTDLKTMRSLTALSKQLHAELDEIRNEEHKIGLRMHRAWRRLEQEELGWECGFWVKQCMAKQ